MFHRRLPQMKSRLNRGGKTNGIMVHPRLQGNRYRSFA